MKTRERVVSAMAIAAVLAALTSVLLLSGHVRAAIWMEGPYYPLTRLLPGSVDTLSTMVIVVAAYYFIASLVALTRSSRRVAILVVLIVMAVNTLGLIAWHLQIQQVSKAAVQDARQQHPAAGAAHRGLKSRVPRSGSPDD